MFPADNVYVYIRINYNHMPKYMTKSAECLDSFACVLYNFRYAQLNFICKNG